MRCSLWSTCDADTADDSGSSGGTAGTAAATAEVQGFEAPSEATDNALRLLRRAENAHDCTHMAEIDALVNASGLHVGDYAVMDQSATVLALLSRAAGCAFFSDELWDGAESLSSGMHEIRVAAAQDLHDSGQAVTGHLNNLAAYLSQAPQLPSPPSPPPSTPPPSPPPPPRPLPPPPPPPPSPCPPLHMPPPHATPAMPPSEGGTALLSSLAGLYDGLGSFHQPPRDKSTSASPAVAPLEVRVQDLLLSVIPTGCTSTGFLKEELGATLSLVVHNPSAFNVSIFERSQALIRQPDDQLVGLARLLEPIQLPPHSSATALLVVDFRYVVARLGLDLDIKTEVGYANSDGASHTLAILRSITGMLLHVDASIYGSALGMQLAAELLRVGYFRIRPPEGPPTPPPSR
mgnify:CR=1 FL=1